MVIVWEVIYGLVRNHERSVKLCWMHHASSVYIASDLSGGEVLSLSDTSRPEEEGLG